MSQKIIPLEPTDVYITVRETTNGDQWLDIETARFHPEGTRIATEQLNKEWGYRFEKANKPVFIGKFKLTSG